MKYSKYLHFYQSLKLEFAVSCCGLQSGKHNNIQEDPGMSESAELQQLFNKFY